MNEWINLWSHKSLISKITRTKFLLTVYVASLESMCNALSDITVTISKVSDVCGPCCCYYFIFNSHHSCSTRSLTSPNTVHLKYLDWTSVGTCFKNARSKLSWTFVLLQLQNTFSISSRLYLISHQLISDKHFLWRLCSSSDEVWHILSREDDDAVLLRSITHLLPFKGTPLSVSAAQTHLFIC